MAQLMRLFPRLAALLFPLVLTGCLLTPGKFVSTLRIDADRHFAFTYVGEVYSADIEGAMAKGMQAMTKAKRKPGVTPPSPADAAKADKAAADARIADAAKTDERNRAIAVALGKEAGYRKVSYLGSGKFSIDYAISGTLDRGFVWPYNLDAEIVFPFVALEVRGNDTVRVKAPGFATENDMTKSMGGMGSVMGSGATDTAPSQLDGSFTLDTDAEIVSQNQEDGVKTAGGRKVVRWHATPTSKDAPTAVLRFR